MLHHQKYALDLVNIHTGRTNFSPLQNSFVLTLLIRNISLGFRRADVFVILADAFPARIGIA